MQRLGKLGAQVIIPFRGDPNEYRHLKLMGDVGQIVPVEFNPRDSESIQAAVEHSNAVVNLIGRHYATKNYTLEEANTAIPADIAAQSKKAGVQRLLHVSAIGARTDAPGPYLQAKYQGELAVREAFGKEAIIVRPTVLFGAEDAFLNRYARFFRNMPVVPIFEGEHSKHAPVYSVDVARGIVNAVSNPDFEGMTFELEGPETFTMQELLDCVRIVLKSDRQAVHVPPIVTNVAAMINERLPTHPMVTRDLALRRNENRVAGASGESHPGFDALGVAPTPVQAVALSFLRRYRQAQVLYDL